MLGGEVNWELRSPQDFDTATRFVRPEDMRESLLISSDLGRHAAWLADYIELGFSELQLHQVGRKQDGLLEAFGAKVIPQLRMMGARTDRPCEATVPVLRAGYAKDQSRRLLQAAAASVTAGLNTPQPQDRSCRISFSSATPIFDNGAYVAGGPDVATQLRAVLPPGWQATLLAVDGAATSDVRRQLTDLPSAASYLVVSVGGNDALGQAGALDEQARSMAGALDRLAGIREQFEQDYRGMLEDVLSLDLPTGCVHDL